MRLKHPDAVVGAVYVRPDQRPSQLLEGLKAGLTLAGSFHGESLRGVLEEALEEEEVDENYFRGQIPLLLTGVPKEHGLLLWGTRVCYEYDRSARCAVLQFELLLTIPGRVGADLAWELTLQILKGCAVALNAELAAANGLHEARTLPRGQEIGPSDALPSLFTPWTFIGPRRLTDERRARLAALPVEQVEELGGGLVIRAVADLFSEPKAGLSEALKSVPNPTPIEFRLVQPRLDWHDWTKL